MRRHFSRAVGICFIFAVFFNSPVARAEPTQQESKPSPNPHAVGWLNTFVPGAGRVMLGEPWRGLGEATIEIGTFAYGYHLSDRSPLSLDGVMETYPAASPGNDAPIDLTRPISGAFLQEVGIKLHMVSTFEDYRTALIARGGDLGQGIETKSAGELFLEPFQSENLTNPWVYIPLILVAGYTAYDYKSELDNKHSATQPLSPASNRFVAFNQMALYPVGSGAPEEMFYRGFVQNEAYYLTRSSWASVLLSSLAFGLSHSGDDRLHAGISGLYMGFLAAHGNGKLGAGITLHFWSVFFLGVESYLLVKHAQAGGLNSQPVGLSFSAPFQLL